MRKRLAAKIVLGVFSALAALLLAVLLFFAIAESIVDDSAHIPPLRPREDISELILKEEWTDEDIDVLYHQTGLTRIGLESLKGRPRRILDFQEALYLDYAIGHEPAAFTTPHDYLMGYRIGDAVEKLIPYTPIAPLEEGDVILTSSCHTFGWRNGHAAIIADADGQVTIESVGPGYLSGRGSTDWFAEASNFMVLRLKGVSAEDRREIAKYAELHLSDVDYSILMGLFGSPKDQGTQPKTTNCSHLVWQAFKYFGYDIDSDGGAICTTRDIANCDLFEVVQVFGFDQDKLWH